MPRLSGDRARFNLTTDTVDGLLSVAFPFSPK